MPRITTEQQELLMSFRSNSDTPPLKSVIPTFYKRVISTFGTHYLPVFWPFFRGRIKASAGPDAVPNVDPLQIYKQLTG